MIFNSPWLGHTEQLRIDLADMCSAMHTNLCDTMHIFETQMLLPRDLNTVNFFSSLKGGSFFIPAATSPSSAYTSACVS